jgi:hypothetical protein
MKKRLHILIIILTLGFFLSPNLSYACGTKTEKSCCKKETTSKTEKKDCCKNKQSEDKDNSCSGKCGHSNCTSSTMYDIEFKNDNFSFSPEKPNFHYSKSFISSGYSSVWLPPKIK